MSSTTGAKRSTSQTAACEHADRDKCYCCASWNPEHDHYRPAIAATTRVIESGESLHVAAQSIAEFWAVATRPAAQNGLGLDVTLASSAIAEIERTYELLLSDERWSIGFGSAGLLGRG